MPYDTYGINQYKLIGLFVRFLAFDAGLVLPDLKYAPESGR